MRPRTLFSLWLLALAWLGWSAFLRPLHLPDEARYVGVAWEMMRSGDWLVPTLNGSPFFHKPPLFYWLTAGSMTLLGVSEWPARVAPLLAASACAVTCVWFARRWLGADRGTPTLVAIVTQPLYLVAAQFANLDMLVASCIAITIVLLAHSALCRQSGQNERGALVAAYAVAGLGVLAKGLIAIALPGLVLVLWLLLRRQWQTLLRLMWCPAGLALFAAITVPWFWLMQLRFDDFLNYFFVHHHFRRFAAEGFNNVQPWYFYGVLLLAVTLPVWPWLARNARPRGLLNTHADAATAVRQLLWLWVLAITMFFSLPQSKPLGYILPVLPALALLAADGYAAHQRAGGARRRTQWLWWGALGLSACVGLAVVGFYTVQPHRSARLLGMQLGQQLRPDDQVVTLHRYPFDVPFYARLPQPMVVVENWREPDILRSDSWPKELSEAAHFLVPGTDTRLAEPGALSARLCAASRTWLIGHGDEVRRYPLLQKLDRIYQDADSVLWQVRRADLVAQGQLVCPAPAP